jgi:AcrR family transcriptional regulator
MDAAKSSFVSAAGEAERAGQSSLAQDSDTKHRVIQATLTSIIERGYYRASSNEIARTAGVSWGVIQHHFGTREALMLAVLQDGSNGFTNSVQAVHIRGNTVRERIDQLLDILSRQYARKPYLAQLQILLNMDRDPKTSSDVRATMRLVAERSNSHVRRLLTEALGSAARVEDLATTIFLVLRGFGLSQQLLSSMSYDSLVPESDDSESERRLLGDILTPYIQSIETSGR